MRRIEVGETVLVKDDFTQVRLPDRKVIYVGRYPAGQIFRPYMPEAEHVGVLADSGVPIPFRDSDIVGIVGHEENHRTG